MITKKNSEKENWVCLRIRTNGNVCKKRKAIFEKQSRSNHELHSNGRAAIFCCGVWRQGRDLARSEKNFRSIGGKRLRVNGGILAKDASGFSGIRLRKCNIVTVLASVAKTCLATPFPVRKPGAEVHIGCRGGGRSGISRVSALDDHLDGRSPFGKRIGAGVHFHRVCVFAALREVGIAKASAPPSGCGRCSCGVLHNTFSTHSCERSSSCFSRGDEKSWNYRYLAQHFCLYLILFLLIINYWKFVP